MLGPFVDLHCHTRASFDCLASPKAVVVAAAERGLTHLAITDHDRIDGALEARQLAPAGLTVLVGEEVRTRDGDLICVFLDAAIPPGLSAVETIAAAREQGGLVGIPHPFDRLRGSLLRDARMEALASSVDWVETHNARLIGGGNERAAEFARKHGLPGGGRLRRSLDPGGRRGLHRPRRRPVDPGRPAVRAGRRRAGPGTGQLRHPRLDAACHAHPAGPRERPNRSCRGPASTGFRDVP